MRPLPADPLADVHAAYHGELLAFARARLGGRADEAEDLLQDVWSAYANLFSEAKTTGGEVVEQPRAWLYRALRNRITDHYRRRATRPGIVALDAGEEPWAASAGVSPAITPGVLATAEDDFWPLVEAALATLPAAQRETFTRNVLDGETLQAIADDLRIPLRTAISRKRYARQRLQTLLADAYANFFGD